MKIVAVLQARTSSTRLPGKILKPILGVPMIVRQIERVKRSATFSRLVVATSTDKSDDPLAELGRKENFAVHRGSLNDVLDRFHGAVAGLGADHVVRLTGDCPLADPAVIDQTVARHIEGGFDYTSNCLEPSFPDGLDCEVMTAAALDTAWRDARLPSEREHVTPFLYREGTTFNVGLLRNDRDLSALRWTVDEPADFEFVSAVYQALWPAKHDFGMDDVLALIERRPELAAINAAFKRNEGLEKSRRADEAVNKGTR